MRAAEMLKAVAVSRRADSRWDVPGAATNLLHHFPAVAFLPKAAA
jgi:hypothetical protein